MTNPQRFEFLGPYLGPTFIIFGLPLVCFALAFGVESVRLSDLETRWKEGQFIEGLDGFLLVWSYGALVIALHLLLPGRIVQGTKLSNGSQLDYKLNSLLVFVVIYGGVFCLSFGIAGSLSLHHLHEHWISCLIASIVLSFALSVYLFLSSFHSNGLLSHGGNTGYYWYDFFIGRELNPRIGGLDLKEFCELYPGLIAWTLLNLSNAQHQFLMNGYITNSMILVNLFQFIYVFDALYFENSILTTMDITSDGFGFMLAFGDLTWVPFIYSLQSKYLSHHPIDLSFGYACFVSLLFLTGYWIFRGANSQKDQFRRDPEDPRVRGLKTLTTRSGRRLIISSWWSLARHINYTGDWLLGLSWCLCCGFDSPVPYFYSLYFGILLIHRDLRDQESCRKKYGQDWDKYCSLVPYRFIPFVY